jgi:hypothetical protein
VKTVVVAAAASGLGKTAFCAALIGHAASRGLSTSAVKLSRAPGHDPEVLEGPGREGSDTSRFIEAGAIRAALVRYRDPCQMQGLLPRRADADLLVLESNKAAAMVRHDLLVYITGAVRDPKDPGLAGEAGLVLRGPPGPGGFDREALEALSMLFPG